MLRRFTDWASQPLEAITPDMVRTRLIDLAQQLENHNANRHLTAIKAVFSQAVKDGFLTRNPCYGLPKFPVEKVAKYIPPKEHISQILLKANAMDQAYLMVIWLTGARVREINRLTWEDIDFDRLTLRLWTCKKKHGDKTFRLIPMVQEVYRALQYVWENRDPLSPYVFTNPKTGTSYDYRDKFLATICKRLGIAKITYHDFRHTLPPL
jgi:integrase